MSDSPTFEDKDEAIRYWKQLAEERKTDFDELEEMSKELEKDQDRQIEQLENDNKSLKSQVNRLRTDLDDLREKHRDRDRTREEELQSTKERLQLTQTEKNELAEQVRQLEQAIDDLERKNRQLVESYEQAEELNQIEMERNALLETEISHGEKLKEVIQRLKDEKRDLKSELENKEKKWKTLESVETKVVTPTSTASASENASHENRQNGFASNSSPLLSSSSSLQRMSKSASSHSTSSASRMSALSIVGDLLKKVGALETKLASCRTFVRDNTLDIDQSSSKVRTPLRNNCRANILSPKAQQFTPSKKPIDISLTDNGEMKGLPND